MCGDESGSEELLLVRSSQWSKGFSTRMVSLIWLNSAAKSLGHMINRWAQPWPKIYRCGYRTHLFPFGLSFALYSLSWAANSIKQTKRIWFGNPSSDRRRVSFPLADRFNCVAAPIQRESRCQLSAGFFPPNLMKMFVRSSSWQPISLAIPSSETLTNLC